MKVFLLILSMLFSLDVAAQVASGEAGVVTGSRRYTRVAGDSVYLRRDVVSPAVEPAGSEARAESSVRPRRRRARAEEQRVDSLSYTARRYALGDRVIMRGDSGADVRKLAEILVKNLYVDERLLQYNAAGDVLYEGELVEGVMRFQRVNGFYPDGIVGRELATVLKRL